MATDVAPRAMKAASSVSFSGMVSPWKLLGDDFRLIIGAAIALVGLIVFSEASVVFQAVRVLLASLFVLFVPGYAIITAIFPLRSQLVRGERVALSIGLSLAAVSIVAFVLNLLGAGLRPWSILLALYLLAGAFMSVALWQRLRLPAQARYSGQLARPSRQAFLGTRRNLPARIAGGLLLILASLGIVIVLAPNEEQSTEFYVLGRAGEARDYPYVVEPGGEVTVLAGVTSHEAQAAEYHIETWAPTDSGVAAPAFVSAPFRLAPGDGWQQPITWRMSRADDDQQVELLLFRAGAAETYRALTLWIDIP